MFKNYLKVAFRNLSKRKVYTFINISGLAIGVACCLLIVVYVYHESTYDRFYQDTDRIYRLVQTSISPTKEEAGASTPFKAGPTLQAEYPQLIESSVRFFNMREPAITFINKKEKKSFRESNFFFTDSTFFDLFSVDLEQGNSKTALAKPLTMVITRKAARKYFGDKDPIGRTLKFKGVKDFTITGILKEWPEKSHISIDALASMSSLNILFHGQPYDKSWFWNPCWTYIKLKKGVAPAELNDQFAAFSKKYYSQDRPKGEKVVLHTQPISSIHLYSQLDSEIKPNNSIFYIYLFSGVAVLILVIACVNFVNLATARSAERGKEVGMRKVLGADRSQLFRQFTGESFLMSSIAVLVALLLAYFMLPWFNHFIGKNLSFTFFESSKVVLGLLGLITVVGLSAGIYPALYVSSFEPTQILRGSGFRGSNKAGFRKVLIIFQFALSALLIVGTMMIYLQLRHMQEKRLGFDKEQIILLPAKQNLIAWEFPKFKEQALKDPSIISVTGSSKILGSDRQVYEKFTPAAVTKGRAGSNQTLYVTYDFFKTYGIDLIAGRPFSKDFSTDKDKAVIINKEMLKQMKIDDPQQAIGKGVYYYPPDAERKSFTIIGVADNFNYTSIKKAISPVVIRLVEGEIPIVSSIEYAEVRVRPGHIQEAIGHLRSVWEDINFVDPFEYSFQDERLSKIYAPEMNMRRLTSVFSVLAILVACLGLFGLASFTVARRSKEIGIRKALGASTGGILYLLFKEYIKLVLLANVIAWPVMYYLAQLWLQKFPYRISLGWNIAIVFAISALFSVLVCLLTVSYQSVKAALINPVDTMRSE